MPDINPFLWASPTTSLQRWFDIALQRAEYDMLGDLFKTRFPCEVSYAFRRPCNTDMVRYTGNINTTCLVCLLPSNDRNFTATSKPFNCPSVTPLDFRHRHCAN